MTEVLKVFLSYASQDRSAVQELYDALKAEDWIDPWLDLARILPGQDWRVVIEKAVEEADVVIICLSTRSVNKEGFVQRELKYASDIALEKPAETIFLIPLRLDDCEIPRGLRSLQRDDYFGSEKNQAYSSLLSALKLRYEQKHGSGKVGVPSEKPSPANAAIKKTNTDPSARPKPKKGERTTRPVNGKALPAKTPVKSKPRPKKRRVEPSVMAAIIGVVGTILATVITVYANRVVPTPTPLPTSTVTLTSTVTDTLTPTLTATLPTPTFTFTPDLKTPSASPTLTPIPPVALGEDWTNGCISRLWKTYPSTIISVDRGDGCWKEPVYVYSAQNGGLEFLSERKSGPSEIYGLFAPLPETGTVTFTIRLRDLTNVDLWMGIFAEPDIASNGLLMIIPNGDTKKRVFVQKDPQTYKNIASTITLEQGSGFSLSFAFNTLSATGRLIPNIFTTSSHSIPTEQKWLFLGYKGLPGYYRIQGSFLKFELKP